MTHSDFPRNFAHCLASTCPQNDACLRWKAYEVLPDDMDEWITFVNPKRVPPAQRMECPYFLKMEQLRYAKGMKHLFDSVPHSDALGLKRELAGYFGHSTYYRCVRGERLIAPEEQAHIKKLFALRGLSDELHFDAYVEQYAFS
ncbi:MAG: DUF6078 family protein [Petrimonas sp.]|nr:DUF6078 family protein [Petrimonas sp.]